MNNELESLLRALTAEVSVTPNDANCQRMLADYLQKLGFTCEHLDSEPVSNLFARFGGEGPMLLFAGHTDVVPAGDLQQWNTPPFNLVEKDGIFYGRGVADMKGSLACMMLAAKAFVEMYPKPHGSLAFLITSGEEGDDFMKGTPHVMRVLSERGIHPDYCIVGEPSSSERVGDVIKIGRRGSLSLDMLFQGKQGHVAYPHLADNPVHKSLAALAELARTEWDRGNAHFPPTSLQITRVKAGEGAGNIIPGTLEVSANFRFSTEHSAESLIQATEACFKRHELTPKLTWRLNGEPFLTSHGRLLEAVRETITDCGAAPPECSTSGGTSDGRFIAPYNVEVVELGPVNATIHQANECVARDQLEMLTKLYFGIAERLAR